MRIIYFDIDCLRPDHLGCYGYARPTSPAIDRVASEGIRFDNYYCASSPCLPSRTCMSSGRFGIRNGVVSNLGAGARFRIRTTPYDGPEPDNDVFPRVLKAAGYDSICFSTFADRHNAMWFMRGWSEYHTPNLKCGLDMADEVNEKVLPWLRKNGSRDNYFLHINYWDAHRIYKMDASWAERFRDHPVPQKWPDESAIADHQALDGPFTARTQFPDNRSSVPLMPGAVTSRSDFETMITGYDAAIAYVDHHINQVLDELSRQGVLEETAIIISADHADAFGEHGIYSDHVNVSNCVHRIPLIVRWPGVTDGAGGSADASMMYNVDFAPTICDLLGVSAPSDWDGASYADNVRGEAGRDRDYLVWDSGLYTVQRAVRTRRHLYIRTYDALTYTNWDAESLYDLEADPYETTNIAADAPSTVREAREIMDSWVSEQRKKPDWADDPLQAVLGERGIS